MQAISLLLFLLLLLAQRLTVDFATKDETHLRVSDGSHSRVRNRVALVVHAPRAQIVFGWLTHLFRQRHIPVFRRPSNDCHRLRCRLHLNGWHLFAVLFVLITLSLWCRRRWRFEALVLPQAVVRRAPCLLVKFEKVFQLIRAECGQCHLCRITALSFLFLFATFLFLFFFLLLLLVHILVIRILSVGILSI